MKLMSLRNSPGLLGRWPKLKKGLVALAVSAAVAGSALAHTVSIGYVNAGPGAVTFWYSSYHSPAETPAYGTEGSMKLEGINGNPFPATTVPFTLHVTTKPTGLVVGVNNTYVGGYNDSRVFRWQGATFTGLAPGDYRFTYVPRVTPAPTATWAPLSGLGSATLTVTTALLIAAPNANAGPDVTVNQGDFVMLDGLASADGNTPALPITYSWTQLSGPAAIGFSATNTATPTFTAPAVPAAGAALVFQLTVSNGSSVTPGTDTVTVNVRGNSPPTANAGPDQPNVSAGANCTASITLAGSGTDSDGTIASYAWSGSFGTVSGQNPTVTLPIGVHTVTLTVTDDKGATGTDTVVITVKDTTAPALTVPANIVVSNDPAKCGANVSFAVSASDTCSGVTVVTTPASGSFFPIGTTLVTSVATDGANNSTTKTFTVTVNDTEKPVIVAGGDILVGTDAGLCTATVNLVGAATATDNCAGVTVSYSPAGPIFARGQTVVTATATDAAGNTATTTFKVTVQDREKPAIVTAAVGKTVECDGAGNTAALSAWLASNGGATATDNCSTVVWTNNFTALTAACGATGSTTVVFTATDGSGNSSTTTATFTIVDTTKPVLGAAAANSTVECSSSSTSALNAWLAANGGATATDACGTVAWTNNFTALNVGPAGTGSVSVTFTATDACGNATSTTATFAIVDTKAPVVTAAANATVECDGAGNTAALAAWLASNGGATATDACSSVTWTNNFTRLTAACGATGSATVTFTATDASGNSATTTATFTIVDTTKPVVTAAANKTVETDGLGNTAALGAWLASNGGATATDTCSGVTWTNNYSALARACGSTGSATVTFTATDACGNASSTTATFTIVDTTKPTIAANVRDISPNIKPDTFIVSSTDIGGTTTPSIVKVTATRTNPQGKVQDFTDSYKHTITGNKLVIEITGGVDTVWTIYGSAVDACGNTTTATYIVRVVNPTLTK